MLVISDSYTFLLENVAKSKNIHIEEIINLDQNYKTFSFRILILNLTV